MSNYCKSIENMFEPEVMCIARGRYIACYLPAYTTWQKSPPIHIMAISQKEAEEKYNKLLVSHFHNVYEKTRENFCKRLTPGWRDLL